jgi:hypothetical protein
MLKLRSLTAFCSVVCFGLAAAHEAPPSPPTRLPQVTSTANRSVLNEEQPIGESGRPAWTSARRFSTTRVYIQKEPWEVGFEQWWRMRDKKDGTTENKFQEEIEIGLPYRMQLDIYVDWFADEHRRAWYSDTVFELRFAFADWGKLWLNPAIYAEYKVVDKDVGPDVYELKLLLGEQLAPRLHWGLNVVYEQETGGERATEWQVSQGLSYTVVDEVLSVGVEMKYVHETVEGARGEPEHKFLIGPSVQIRPTPRTHLDVVALWGTTEDSPYLEGYVIFGIDFGGGESRYKPSSTRSN